MGNLIQFIPSSQTVSDAVNADVTPIVWRTQELRVAKTMVKRPRPAHPQLGTSSAMASEFRLRFLEMEAMNKDCVTMVFMNAKMVHSSLHKKNQFALEKQSLEERGSDVGAT